MSLLNSLTTGVSGLRNHQTMMDVIGDNIANVNSIGFKGSRVTFSDAFSQFVRYGTNPTATSGGTNTFQSGLGMQVNSIDKNWNQGTFERTGISTDLGLQGSAMFILQKNGQRFYSRAGAFNFDANGLFVNSQNGAQVMGKMAGLNGDIPSGNNLEKITIDYSMKLPAATTKNISWNGNLKSSAPVTRSEKYTETGNLNSATLTGEAITDKNTIYDSDGNSYVFATSYAKTGADAYDLSYTLKDSTGTTVLSSTTPTAVTFDPTTGAMVNMNGAPAAAINITDAVKGINFSFDPTTVTQKASTTSVSSSVDANRIPTAAIGTLAIFDSLGNSHSLTLKFTKISDNNWKWTAAVPAGSGALTGNSGNVTFNTDGTLTSFTNSTPSVNFTPTGGAASQIVKLDFGASFSGVTQTSGESTLSPLSQDGMAAASLLNLNVDNNGNVVGVFSNGESKNLAQIMLANFSNLNGLVATGDNLYKVSANSGAASVGEAGDATRTSVQSGSLEQSNVDLSIEFTKMIVAQRGFQANARVITTSDSLLQEITNLTR